MKVNDSAGHILKGKSKTFIILWSYITLCIPLNAGKMLNKQWTYAWGTNPFFKKSTVGNN